MSVGLARAPGSGDGRSALRKPFCQVVRSKRVQQPKRTRPAALFPPCPSRPLSHGPARVKRYRSSRGWLHFQAVEPTEGMSRNPDYEPRACLDRDQWRSAFEWAVQLWLVVTMAPHLITLSTSLPPPLRPAAECRPSDRVAGLPCSDSSVHSSPRVNTAPVDGMAAPSPTASLSAILLPSLSHSARSFCPP